MKFLLEYGRVPATEDPKTSPLAKLPGGLYGNGITQNAVEKNEEKKEDDKKDKDTD
jgi:hypothetical protein